MLDQLPLHVFLFIAFLVGLLVSFIIFFCLPAFWTGRHLDLINEQLKQLKGQPAEGMANIFQGRGVFELLWREYSHTLHRQSKINPETGAEQLIKIRSTFPSETFFKQESVIDNPTLTEFFKHLPGLFTGIGIIGTFYGLINGLNDFKISGDVAQVHLSLSQLLQGVRSAFLVSFIAILLSMCVTFIEKIVMSSLQIKLERLHQHLDGLFEGGAGEEYLARLVHASEASAHQTEYMNTGMQGLVEQLGHAGQRQGDKVMYEEMLAQFSKNLEKIMEQQNHSQQQMLQTLEKVAQSFDKVLGGDPNKNTRFDQHIL
jgi:hypothetical protein